MRTTIRLDEALLREAKQFAARRGRTLTAVIDEALRRLLASEKHGVDLRKFAVRPFSGTGLTPGVDLDDSGALRELMDEGLPVAKQR